MKSAVGTSSADNVPSNFMAVTVVCCHHRVKVDKLVDNFEVVAVDYNVTTRSDSVTLISSVNF